MLVAKRSDVHLLSQIQFKNGEKIAAYQKERKEWDNSKVFSPVSSSELPTNARVIGSHTIFKRKDCSRLEACLVPWGLRDSAKPELRTDSLCPSLKIFCHVLSIATEQQ